MTIHIQAGKDWFLRSKIQGTDWGPFDTKEKAWHYLFGRESTDEERALYESAGWSTFQETSAVMQNNDPKHELI